jgi:signal transduction histidine kinase
VPASPSTLWWVFLVATLALGVILFALGAAIVIYQRRFLALHRTYATNMLRAQEEERAWVAREVHDDALQHIALIQRDVASVRGLQPALTAEQDHRVTSVQNEMEDLSAKLRGLAHRLHPALIEKGGLRAALEGLCGDIERAYPISVERRLPERMAPLEPQRALAIYRIAQEALRNVATHSGAKAATLELSQDEEKTELAVFDFGTGFDSRARRPSDGLGLIGMRERAHLASGTMTVNSRPGHGTVVRASFPVVPEVAV